MFALAPGYVLRDEIARELLAQRDERSDDAEAGTMPSFATDETVDGEVLTGEVADGPALEESTKTPR